MKKRYHNRLLTQAVLASTLFISPLLDAAPQIINAATIVTALSSNGTPIEITQTGSILANSILGVALNTNGGILNIDPNNALGANAIQTLGLGIINAINVSQPNGLINIGSGSGVTNLNIIPGTDVILFNNAANGILNNSGSIINNGIGSGAAIDLVGTSSNGKN